MIKKIATKLSLKEKIGYSVGDTAIKLMISVFPGILYMSCAIFLFFYPINRKMAIQMQEELEQRKADSN